jgi:hypothetical protein
VESRCHFEFGGRIVWIESEDLAVIDQDTDAGKVRRHPKNCPDRFGGEGKGSFDSEFGRAETIPLR